MPETPRDIRLPFIFLLKEKFSKLHFALVYASTKTTRNQFKREDGTSWSNIEEKPPCRG